MDQEKKNAIALMRYSVIAPLITGLSDDYDSLTAFFNNALRTRHYRKMVCRVQKRWF